MSTASELRHGGCPLCGGKTAALPAPNPDRSVVSDGQLVWHALRRLSCLACGAACHGGSLSPDDVRVIYAREYELAKAAPNSDAARARAYAAWLSAELSPPLSILEVGCGSGALMRELSNYWPDALCTGIDPALPDTVRSDSKFRMERGFVEDMPGNIGAFDLIVAINVIEHTLSPAVFLQALNARLAAHGRVVIVCPAAEPPNVELLFYDHLYSLTSSAMVAAAGMTPLAARRIASAPAAIGDFQMVLFDNAAQTAPFSLGERGFVELTTARRSYLEGWINLDAALLTRLGSGERFVAFGGGQTASLLRAYAPLTWGRLEMVILDDVGEAWNLGKPVASYSQAVDRLEAAAVLIATAPRFQDMIARRLQKDGLRPIRYDDLISR